LAFSPLERFERESQYWTSFHFVHPTHVNVRQSNQFADVFGGFKAIFSGDLSVALSASPQGNAFSVILAQTGATDKFY
jgi:hypothetical protein